MADEDYWYRQIYVEQLLWPSGGGSVVSPPAFGIDEDYWYQQSVPCLQFAPAQTTIILGFGDEFPFGQLEEEYWQNPVQPVVASLLWSQPFLWDVSSDLPVPPPPLGPEEDFVIIAPQVNPWRAPLFVEQDEIPAGSLHGQPDEDFWQNPVEPVPASLWQPLPLLWDAQETVPPIIFATPDEDFWSNPTSPQPATVYQKLPLGDVEELPAGSLYGVPEEEYWQNQAKPLHAVLYQRLPYLADTDELGQFVPLGIDEDFWQNQVPPMGLAFIWPQQWMFSDADKVPTITPPPPPAFGPIVFFNLNG